MSDLRATAEQARDVLRHAVDELGRCGRAAAILPCVDALNSLEAALEQKAELVACHWHQDGDFESNTWAASCGQDRYFTLTDGTPNENDMTHCCYCGKQLVEVPIEEGQR
jgi:hypothetical protein